MPLTFIHLSDTHLGFSDLDQQDEEGKNIREEDVYKSFSDAVDIVLDEKPDFVIHSGDIFHRSSPSNRALVEASKQISRIASAGIPFYMIAGNHDFPKSIFTSPVHDLYKINDLVKIAFNEELEIFEEPDYTIHLLPHINSEEKFLEEAAKIKITDSGKINILAMHIALPEYLMNEFGERVFPPERKDILKDFDYVALGHWHRVNHLKKYGNVFYCGSTERTSDTQTGYDKGILKVTIDGGTKTEFIPLKLREYRKIEITDCCDRTEDEILDALKSECGEKIEGGIFRVKLIDIDPVKNNNFSKAYFQNIFEGALDFRVEKLLKGSEDKFEIEGGTFDLKEYFFEDLSNSFEGENLQKIEELSKRFWEEIEEEESDANQ